MNESDINVLSSREQLPDLSVFLDILGIIASDGWIWEREPFTRQVKPGAYPLLLAVAKGKADYDPVAFAMLRFSQAKVAKWEVALTAGEDPNSLEEGEVCGYGTDSGMGCFMDREAKKLLDSSASPPDLVDRISEVLAKLNKETRLASAFVQTPKGSAALFGSGEGDGVYASYFGLDASGNAVALVADFGIANWPRRPAMR